MDFKETMKRVFYHFFFILSGSVISMYVLRYIGFLVLANRTEGIESIEDIIIRMHDITALLILSAVLSLANFVFYTKKELSKGHLLIRYIVHFFIVLITTLRLGIFMGWVGIEYIFTIILLTTSVVIIYVIVFFHDIHQSKKLVKTLNQKLKEYYKK